VSGVPCRPLRRTDQASVASFFRWRQRGDGGDVGCSHQFDGSSHPRIGVRDASARIDVRGRSAHGLLIPSRHSPRPWPDGPAASRVASPSSNEFSHRGFFAQLSHTERSLYFFLVLAADRNGVSFYAHDLICATLELTRDRALQG